MKTNSMENKEKTNYILKSFDKQYLEHINGNKVKQQFLYSI